MTGIADLFVLVKKPHSKDARKRAAAIFHRACGTRHHELNRFVVLSWKRTGSNLLCGILFNHHEIAMHNELFNPIDTFTYYQDSLKRNEEDEIWTPQGRDLYPEAFLEHIWTGRNISGILLKPKAKSVGFKSFPDHWWESRNDHIFEQEIMDDPQVKKVVLFREDELAVYVSMKRAEITGLYMTKSYPMKLKIHVDPVAFQIFTNKYHDVFQRRYKSSMPEQDTFPITYEQIIDEENFERNMLPLLWDFLGVDNTVGLKKLRETVKQANPEEDLSSVIGNYKELEFCFRYTDVKHFKARYLHRQVLSPHQPVSLSSPDKMPPVIETDNTSWSILLPICSRNKQSKNSGIHQIGQYGSVEGVPSSRESRHYEEDNEEKTRLVSKDRDFASNRFHDLAMASQYSEEDGEKISYDLLSQICWDRLEKLANSLRITSTEKLLKNTECIVGIDEDDPIFNNQKERIRMYLQPCMVRFVAIKPDMYGRLCRIWNYLGQHAKNNFIVLLGDDIILNDKNWQQTVDNKFREISYHQKLPFGAGCVALYDESFPGFSTFPVVHRWHIEKFGTILPRQFVNQGGDPYLFDLYSRYNAADFATTCRLENTIGGDDDARYKKYDINWKGQILRLNLMHLKDHLEGRNPSGFCIDIVIPSYRTNNDAILESILRLESSKHAYVKFWLVVDNPDEGHLQQVKSLVTKINQERFDVHGNYFVTVLHYGENRGASYARNLGFNYSTADWTLFLDDDVRPSNHLLDAYLGAILRYPNAKVFVGNTELPPAFNVWTKMLRTCNIMFFYGISKHVPFPPWGVTANIMVCGSRHNGTVQFKNIYPRTGGGEDIDFCFQIKDWYGSGSGGGGGGDNSSIHTNHRIIVAVPGATAYHPWWNNDGTSTCYGQINGWAWGDSLCISEWPEKCYWSFPNWIEFIVFVIPMYHAVLLMWTMTTMTTDVTASTTNENNNDMTSMLYSIVFSSFLVLIIEHLWLTITYYPSACRHVQKKKVRGVFTKIFVAFGAGTILSFQEVTRLVAHWYRFHIHIGVCRRIDWNDGQDPMVKLDTQLRSLVRFVFFTAATILVNHNINNKNNDKLNI